MLSLKRKARFAIILEKKRCKESDDMCEFIIRDAVIEDAERLVDIYSYYIKETAVSFEYKVPSVDE